MLDLITDRTAMDVSKGTAKGFYNAVDMNRVGEAVETVAALLAPYGYLVDIQVKKDWVRGDIPNESQLLRYLQNVRNLGSVFVAAAGLPVTMSNLYYTGANAIEQTLSDIELLLPEMIAAFRPSGTFYTGE